MNIYRNLTLKQLLYLDLICIVCLAIAFILVYDTQATHGFTKQFLTHFSGPSIEYGFSYSGYKEFVTPDDPAVKEIAAGIKDIEDAYQIANDWIYISDSILNGSPDKWLTPDEFLTSTPEYLTNPAPGYIAGDCEEQSNTLVSILRALETPAEEVRVVLGRVVTLNNIIKGHVWVEIYINKTWLALDPSQGPQWNDDLKQIVYIKGREFNYYSDHIYPITDIIAFYNDTYYLDVENNSGDSPDFWQTK